MNIEKFAARLRAKRAELDITQEELSKQSGLSMATIRAYEQGKSSPTFDSIDAFCKTLKISPNYLLGWEVPVTH